MKCIAIICIVLGYVQGHGRLLQPPSRASMWRFGFDNPRDDTDNEGNCGGRSVRFLLQLALFRTFCIYKAPTVLNTF